MRTPEFRRPAKTRLSWLAVVLTSVLMACGGDDGGTAATSPAPAATAATTAAAPATSDEAVSVSSLPVTDDSTAESEPDTISTDPAAAVTTLAPAPPATVAASASALPVPVAVPVDSRGEEPVVNLGSIEIPKIGLETTMYEGIRLTTLDRGPGHWPGTAMPGQVGNVVVAGHRVSHDKPFRNVDKLVAGDQVIFTTSDGVFTYSVTSTEIVTPDTISIIDQTADKTATLFACHPPGSTRERIVIHLALVEA